MPTISHVEDKLAIRELIENWAVWRDSFQWESVGDINGHGPGAHPAA